MTKNDRIICCSVFQEFFGFRSKLLYKCLFEYQRDIWTYKSKINLKCHDIKDKKTKKTNNSLQIIRKKLKTEQNEPHQKNRLISSAPEGLTDTAAHLTQLF